MYKIKTITFHHAHNYGSVLQAYALQSFVTSICNENNVEMNYEIIDFHSEFQENFYSVFKKNNSLSNVVKNVFSLFYFRSLQIKHARFESFLSERCNLSKRYKNFEELLKDDISADCFISGSDQLWNVRAQDFNDVYYLNFLKNKRKISYAASFGPLNINWELYDKEKYTKLLSDYMYISVREKGSANNIKYLLDKNCEINVDPTLLLDVKEWNKIEAKKEINSEKYILLYSLEPTKSQLKIVKEISKKTGLPVKVLKYNNKYDMINTFVKDYAAGPEEFLYYINNASLVLTSSFHGTAFSLIYKKPFYVIEGFNDNRIINILEKTSLLDRIIKDSTFANVKPLSKNQVDKINDFLSIERKNSKEYLQVALGILE